MTLNLTKSTRLSQKVPIPMEYPKHPSLIIHLKQVLHIRKTKAEIVTGNTIEYDVTSYQFK